jgi:putative hydroxymethylpyrimidine transport system substrate-binding protein
MLPSRKDFRVIRRLLTVATLLALLPWIVIHASAAAPRAQSASLVLDWTLNSDHGGIEAAIQRGVLRRAGINLHAYTPSDTSAQIPIVAAGRADFGVSYETDLLAARIHHVPVQSVMCIMQHPLNTVMALKSSGITRPRQLQGHTVGIAGAPSDEPIVTAMVRHDGGSISKVHFVNVGYSLLPALLARKVDAVVGVYWTWEAIQAREKGYPVNVMRVERWGVPNYCELVLVASEKTVRTRPAFVRATVQALQQGYAYAEQNPVAGWQALAAADKTLAQQRTLVVDSLTLLRGAITDARTVGWQNGAQWVRYEQWLTANKLIPGTTEARAAFTNQFLRAGIR